MEVVFGELPSLSLEFQVVGDKWGHPAGYEIVLLDP